MAKILFIAVHPDDETLGCGGTIIKHRSLGDEVYWMIITNIHESSGWPIEHVVKRQEEIATVSQKYGFSGTHKLDFPTTLLDTIPMGKLISKISTVINHVKPEIVYVPNRSDIHTDHQIAFKAIMSCTKNFRYPIIKRILMYECLSETEFAPALIENSFNPNVFVDVSDYLLKKLDIMKTFTSETMEPPLPRSLQTIESLARFRGSSIGVTFAEAFMLLKDIL